MDWMLRDRWLDALGLLEGLQLSSPPCERACGACVGLDVAR